MSKAYEAIANYTNGFKEGYDMGFKAGYEQGLNQNRTTYSDEIIDKNVNICPVCEVDFTKSFGYMCYHTKCPTNIPCGE